MLPGDVDIRYTLFDSGIDNTFKPFHKTPPYPIINPAAWNSPAPTVGSSTARKNYTSSLKKATNISTIANPWTSC
jgi:hypothetical protein